MPLVENPTKQWKKHLNLISLNFFHEHLEPCSGRNRAYAPQGQENCTTGVGGKWAVQGLCFPLPAALGDTYPAFFPGLSHKAREVILKES